MSNWVFERTPRMGGASGEAIINTLQATGMSPAAVLAREALQNSCDAYLKNSKEKIKVVFRSISLTGNDKENFIKTAGLNNNFLARATDGSIELPQGHCFNNLSDPEIPLKLLFIEDYWTHGLYGKPTDDNSHFFRLLLTIGNGSKARENRALGGSYGFGKAVYAGNSKIHTIFTHSLFGEDFIEDNVKTRLMGCSYFNSHRFNSNSYSGRAWFGKQIDNEDIVDAYENEEAENYAKLLGFSLRNDKQSGTSILLVDSSIDINELRSSIEDWWWPRLCDDNLDIEIIIDGVRESPPRPKIRKDLQPFITCYELANKKAIPLNDTQKVSDLRPRSNKDIKFGLGIHAFTSLDEATLEDEKIQSKLGTVALIRNPHMVVSYEPIQTDGKAVGTFLADENEEINKILTLAEPPAHDRWDERSSRIHLDSDREIVHYILARIKENFKIFMRDLAPPTPQGEQRPKLLERLLGSLFKPKPQGFGPVEGEVDPITIRYVKQPHFEVTNDNNLKVKGSFKVGLNPNFDGETADIQIQIKCLFVEDESIDSSDQVKLNVECSDYEHNFSLTEEYPATMKLSLNKQSDVKIEYESDTYDANYTTQITILASRLN